MLRWLLRRRVSCRRSLNILQGEELEREVEAVPKGYVPVMVGKEKDGMQKFLIHIDMFKNECFVVFLEMVAEEVGYENSGMLRIPCHGESFCNFLNHISRAS